MAGYWPSFFLRACGPSRSQLPKTRKKERSRYLAISNEQAWSIKDLFCGKKNITFLRDAVDNPERDSAILPTRSQSQYRIWFILLAHGVRHICLKLVFLFF